MEAFINGIQQIKCAIVGSHILGVVREVALPDRGGSNPPGAANGTQIYQALDAITLLKEALLEWEHGGLVTWFCINTDRINAVVA